MLSTAWNTQRGSQSYIKKRRGGGGGAVNRGDQEEKREVKRRETDLASNQFPKCSPQPGIPKEIHSWVEMRRGREKIEVTLGRKRRVIGGEGN